MASSLKRLQFKEGATSFAAAVQLDFSVVTRPGWFRRTKWLDEAQAKALTGELLLSLI